MPRLVQAALTVSCLAMQLLLGSPTAAQEQATRIYQNQLTPIADARPLLADHPEYVAPVVERRRYAAPAIVDETNADLHVRAWRFSYNARAIVEAPNHLEASATAVIFVHPWGVDDGQGWRTPQPNGAADFCTVEKNHLAGRHTRRVINPLLARLRPHVQFVMYSLPGRRDPIRRALYRSFDENPSAETRRKAQKQLETKLKAFAYQGEPLPKSFQVDAKLPVIDYFKNFPGLDAGPRYNQAGFWDLPIPVSRDVDAKPDDIVIYDAEGYPPLKKFLKANGVRHVILTGYATDMCFCRTTAGYENLSRDFNVFLVGDATLATFPANASPQHATNAAISFASLTQLVTQCSWIHHDDDPKSPASKAETP